VNDWPCASAAALITTETRRFGRGTRTIRLGLGAVAPTPMFLELDVPADASADEAVEAARETAEPHIDPIPDVRGGVPYKRHLAQVAGEEAVRPSWEERPDAKGFLRARRRRR